jgi:hypothetical protein
MKWFVMFGTEIEKWIKTNTIDYEEILIGSVGISINYLKCLGKPRKATLPFILILNMFLSSAYLRAKNC